LFATLQTASSESLPGVYAYLINCKETIGDMLPFPKQFGPWKDGCYLYEPVEGMSSLCLAENCKLVCSICECNMKHIGATKQTQLPVIKSLGSNHLNKVTVILTAVVGYRM